MSVFFHPELLLGDDTLQMSGDELKHMIGARRHGVGDKVTLFNGRGDVAVATITCVSNKLISLEVLDWIHYDNTPRPRLILASAIPKGDRMNTLLDMSTQLGMSEFIPLITERSNIKSTESRLQRYNRICISACKQSERYVLPEIHSAHSLQDIVNMYNDKASVMLVADRDGESMSMVNGLLRQFDNLVLLVGPEGGFTNNELDMLNRSGVSKVKLSGALLRIEAACVALLSQINHRQIDENSLS